MSSIVKASKTLGTIDPLMCMFDSQSGHSVESGNHKKASSFDDVNVVTEDLQKYKVLTQQSDRRAHPSCNKPKNLLHNKSKETLLNYMEANMPIR